MRHLRKLITVAISLFVFASCKVGTQTSEVAFDKGPAGHAASPTSPDYAQFTKELTFPHAQRPIAKPIVGGCTVTPVTFDTTGVPVGFEVQKNGEKFFTILDPRGAVEKSTKRYSSTGLIQRYSYTITDPSPPKYVGTYRIEMNYDMQTEALISVAFSSHDGGFFSWTQSLICE